MSQWCKDKEYIVFVTISRLVALLVTEISRQNQNFRNIPRIVINWLKKYLKFNLVKMVVSDKQTVKFFGKYYIEIITVEKKSHNYFIYMGARSIGLDKPNNLSVKLYFFLTNQY